MIAVYARQSVDRPDSISIESQIEFCKYEARGAECRTYIDRGFSGKNTKRPAFNEMLSDIDSGLVTRVIVYKLDRISRSILDFSNMMLKFEECRVEFVSSTEKFDTSSPMGRAMLNICIVFAQLERETIQKRVTDAYFARSQKSFYMGGRVPFGFALEPVVLEKVKTSRYVKNAEEAEIVKLMFEMYAEPATSYGDIVREFQRRGITRFGKPWERTRIADILRNPIYVRADMDVYEFFNSSGAIIANPPEDFIGTNGCYYYKGKASAERKQKSLAGNHIVLAPHEGIVDSAVWLACRDKTLRAKQVHTGPKAKNTWLAGKIKCGVCGYALVDKHYQNRNARYLMCSFRMNSRACAGPGTLHTPEVEAEIFTQIQNKLATFATLTKQSAAKANPELTAANIELAQVNAEVTSLMAKLTDANDTMFRYISARIEELDLRKSELTIRISELGRRDIAEFGELTHHVESWATLDFDDRRLVVDQLVNVIRATSDKITIEWRI
ncbi:MAG: recombinase family protein [Oscillospiraceae bacterium]|jgi:DNA invertase Pin-like site-specific DNA recombinase|nr:recombinase family protein [Oscillospiraceae bacterium]